MPWDCKRGTCNDLSILKQMKKENNSALMYLFWFYYDEITLTLLTQRGTILWLMFLSADCFFLSEPPETLLSEV